MAGGAYSVKKSLALLTVGAVMFGTVLIGTASAHQAGTGDA